MKENESSQGSGKRGEENESSQGSGKSQVKKMRVAKVVRAVKKMRVAKAW